METQKLELQSRAAHYRSVPETSLGWGIEGLEGAGRTCSLSEDSGHFAYISFPLSSVNVWPLLAPPACV